MSLIGMVVLLGIAVLLSKNKRAINFRTVGGAFSIQFLFGAFVLYTSVGQTVLGAMTNGVQSIIDFGNDGINFLFGGLTTNDGIGFIFAFNVLPVIIYFSALISVLYYLGIMKWIINLIGGALSMILGSSRAESLSATANIFVGQTEAPLVVRPFIDSMTKSELFAVMCGGLASVAGSVLAGYANMGVPLEYLIAASFMAAPGGLLFAKIIIPESPDIVDSKKLFSKKDIIQLFSANGRISRSTYFALIFLYNLIAYTLWSFWSSETSGVNTNFLILVFYIVLVWLSLAAGTKRCHDFDRSGVYQLIPFYIFLLIFKKGNNYSNIYGDVTKGPKSQPSYDTSVNIIDAAASGASSGLKLALNVGAMLLAFVGLIALINGIFGGVGGFFGVENFTLEQLLGYIFSPLAFLIGVPWEEATTVGSFIGQKLVVNEFVAYLDFMPYLDEGSEFIMTKKSKAIVSFALCGFANLSSIAILLGGLGGIAPSRRGEIARFGLLAVAAGTLSNLMSATIAGLFLSL